MLSNPKRSIDKKVFQDAWSALEYNIFQYLNDKEALKLVLTAKFLATGLKRYCVICEHPNGDRRNKKVLNSLNQNNKITS